jgi:hypothetical protein
MRRLVLGALALACMVYAAGFALDQYLRSRRGPWQVTFEPSAAGEPQLRIRQEHLGIADTCIVFAGGQATNPPVTVRFDTPHLELPFGRVKYDDLTYLPGAVTLEAFGHEIELLPRTLYLDRQPVAWTNAARLVVPI